MTRNSMGQFMAALRKANGMTQQEMADRLGVSNKAVSRWERDECAPDIILIPAIAEMFGVTCDELLRGGRIPQNQMAQEQGENGTERSIAEKGKADARAERQRKALLGRTLSSFKTKSLISILLSVAGLICMFGISYGFYRPVIGFAVLLLFEAGAVTFVVLAINKLKELKENELFEDADAKEMKRFNDCLGSYSFAGLFTVLTVVAVSLPLVMIRSEYRDSVLTFESYCTYLVGIVLVLVLIFLLIRRPYLSWVCGRSEETASLSRNCVLLDAIQLGALGFVLILMLISPCFEEFVPETEEIRNTFMLGSMIPVAFILLVPAALLAFLILEKKEKLKLLLHGLRNMLLLPAVFKIGSAHKVSFGWGTMGPEHYQRHEYWENELILIGLSWILLVFVVFLVLERIVKRARKR